MRPAWPRCDRGLPHRQHGPATPSPALFGEAQLGSTTKSTAHVTFAYDPVLLVYRPTEGRVDVNEDVVTDDCASHIAGAAALGPMDGSIILTDAGQYLAEGSASVDLAGTTGCGGASEPVALTEDVRWWPAPPVGLLFAVKPDGRLEGSFEYVVEDSEEHIEVDWSLKP
jgi:hypothetical protein